MRMVKMLALVVPCILLLEFLVPADCLEVQIDANPPFTTREDESDLSLTISPKPNTLCIMYISKENCSHIFLPEDINVQMETDVWAGSVGYQFTGLGFFNISAVCENDGVIVREWAGIHVIVPVDGLESDQPSDEPQVVKIVRGQFKEIVLRFEFMDGTYLSGRYYLDQKFSNLSVIQINENNKTGFLEIKPSEVADFNQHSVIISISNEISEDNATYRFINVEQIEGVSLTAEPFVLVKQTIQILAHIEWGSNVAYTWRVGGDIYSVGGTNSVEHTFNTLGSVNVEANVSNAVGSKSASQDIEVVKPVSGFTASLLEDDQFNVVIHVPGAGYFPMGSLSVILTWDSVESHKVSISPQPSANMSIPNPLKRSGRKLLVKIESPVSEQSLVLTTTKSPSLGLLISPNPTKIDSEIAISLANSSGLEFHYQVDFGDGEIFEDYREERAEELSLVHVYSDPGKYVITLNVTNTYLSVNLTELITVQTPIMDLTFTAQSVLLLPPGIAELSISTPPTPKLPSEVGCSVDFGDGSANRDMTWDPKSNTLIPYTFLHSGLYYPSIICKNNVSSITKSTSIRVLDYSFSDYIVHYPKIVPKNSSQLYSRVLFTVSLHNLTSPPPNAIFTWDFGDGTASETHELTSWLKPHEFSSRGNFNIKVYVSTGFDEGYLDPYTIQVGLFSIDVDKTHALAGLDSVTMVIGGVTGDTVSYLVDSGHGNVSRHSTTMITSDYLYNVTVLFDVPGMYRPHVMVQADDNLEEQFAPLITVFRPLDDIVVTIDPSTIEMFGSSTLYAGVKEGEAIPANTTCTVDFGDNTESTTHSLNQNVSIKHEFMSSGNLSVRINCSNHLSDYAKTVFVNVNDPCYGAVLPFAAVRSPIRKMVSQQLILIANLDISCTNMTAEFYWSVDASRNGTEVNIPIVQPQTTVLVLAPRSMQPGTYRITFYTNFKELPSTFSTGKVTVIYTQSSIRARIKGGTFKTVGVSMPVILDALTLSRDPDDDKISLHFDWAYGVVDSRPEAEMVVNGSAMATCPSCLRVTLRSESVIVLVPGCLEVGRWHVFTVNVSTPTKSGIFSQIIHVVNDDPPEVDIRCKVNCFEKVNAEFSFGLETECLNCLHEELAQASYQWSLSVIEGGEYRPLVDFSEMTSTGTDISTMSIKPNSLLPGFSYNLKLRISGVPRRSVGAVNLNFIVNYPPYNGSCWMMPKEGFAALDRFQLACDGWKDEGARLKRSMYDTDKHLSYQFSVHRADKQSLIYTGDSPRSPLVELPFGHEDDGYRVIIVASIFDPHHGMAQINITGRVLPPLKRDSASSDVDTVIEKLADRLDRAEITGDVRAVARVAGTSAEVLNVLETPGDNTSLPEDLGLWLDPEPVDLPAGNGSAKKWTELWDNLLSPSEPSLKGRLSQTNEKHATSLSATLQKSNVTSLDVVHHVSGSVSAIVKKPTRVSDDTLVLLERSLGLLGDSLAEVVTEDMSDTHVDTVLSAMVDSIGGVLNAAVPDTTTVGSSPVGNSPVGNTPAGNIPVGNTPVGNTPAGNIPVGDTPVGNIAIGNTPVGNIPVGNTPIEATPVGNTPVGNTIIGNTPISNFREALGAVEKSRTYSKDSESTLKKLDQADLQDEERAFLLLKKSQQQNYAHKQRQKVVMPMAQRLNRSVDQLLSAASSFLVLGQEPKQFHNPLSSALVEKNVLRQFVNRTRSIGGISLETQPVTDTGIGIPTPMIFKASVMKGNPLARDRDKGADRRVELTSPTLQVWLEKADLWAAGNQTPSNLTLVQAVKFPNPEPIVFTPVTPRFIPLDKDRLLYHKLELPSVDHAIVLYIKTGSNIKYEVFFRSSNFPTASQYDFRTETGPFYRENDTLKAICPKQSLSKAGTVYLGFKPIPLDLKPFRSEDMPESPDVFQPMAEGNSNFTNVFGSKFDVGFATIGCESWTNEAQWDDSNCILSDESDLESTTCVCEQPQFSVLNVAQSFMVPPNTIDFSTVFSKIDLKNNSSVLGCVLSLLLLYAFLAVWARRNDRRDLLKWGVTSLADNFIGDHYLYIITVYTGMKIGAGTKSKVGFVVVGEEGDTGIRLLHDGIRNEIASRSIMHFVMAVPFNLGELQYMRIWHDNSGTGSNASWFLYKVVMEDIQTDRRYIFQCNRWLAVEKDDGMIERLLPVSAKQDLVTFSGLFYNNTRKNFTDSHLWFSVILRPQRSQFTRLQRLSCCLCLLFLAMITNAVFYLSDENVVNPTMVHMGIFRFSLQQLYVSVVSLLIVTPVNVLAVWLFKKSKPHWKPIDTAPVESCSCCAISRLMRTTEEEKKLQNALIARGFHNPKQKQLPHCCLYVAWLVVFLSVSLSAFFLFLYSQQWGQTKSEEWLTSFLLSFLESLMIIDPIKVLIVAAVLAVFIRKPEESASEGFDKHEIKSNRNVTGFLEGHTREQMQPLTGDVLKNAQTTRTKEIKAFSVLREIILYVVFLLIVYTIGYSNRDPRSFTLQHHMYKVMMVPQTSLGMTQVRTTEAFYQWVNETVFPNLFQQTYYQGSRRRWWDRYYIRDWQNYRVGPPRMRQVRSPPMAMCYKKVMGEMPCNDRYSMYLQEDQDFCLRWKAPPCPEEEEVFNFTSEAWRFKSFADALSLPVFGYYNTYSGGGYIADLDVNLDVSLKILSELYSELWIDRQTRAVIIEYTVFNANTNLFCYVSLVSEFPETGGVLTYHLIRPFRIYQHTGALGAYIFFNEIVFVIVVLFAIVKVFLKLKRLRWGYFKDSWHVNEFFLLLTCLVCIAIYATREVISGITMSEFRKDPKSYVSFYHITVWDEVLVDVIGVLSFICTVRMIRVLGYSKRASSLMKVLTLAKGDLFYFSIMFFLMFAGFAMVAYLIFGSVIEDYRDMLVTTATLITCMIGRSPFDDMRAMEPFFAQLYFSSFIFFEVFVLLTMFLAILNESIATVRGDESLTYDQHDMVDLLISKLKDTIGLLLPARLKRILDEMSKEVPKPPPSPTVPPDPKPEESGETDEPFDLLKAAHDVLFLKKALETRLTGKNTDDKQKLLPST